MRISDWSSDVCSSDRVSIRNLDFVYGDYRALKSISLPLYDRKVTAFIGPSGCGKSTLLRVLNRMYDLYPGQRATGEGLLEGRNVIDPKTDVNLLRAQIGMVFQKPTRSEEHTSELQSLMRISYAVFCLNKKKKPTYKPSRLHQHTDT